MISPALQELAASSTTIGSIENAETVGRVGTPGEGPFMTMYLRLSDDTITEARFETYGCPTATACGTWVTRWVRGKTTEQAAVLTARDLATVLGGLPLGKEHCADLAVNSLSAAIHGADS